MVIHHVGLSSGAEQSRKQQNTKLRRLGALQQKGRLGLGTLQQKTRRLGRGTLQFLPLGVIAGVTAVSAGVLSEPASTAIETEAITTTVKVLEACSMTANPDSTDIAHSVEMIGGTVENSIGVTTIDVTCNDRDGYSVYAVGYGNNTVGNTDLTGAVTGQTIPTGTNMTTSVSNWAMRLTAVDNSTNYFVPTILSDANGSFAANHAVPSNNTKVVAFQNAIDVSKPSRFTTTYAAAIAPYQAADTYTGQVKYTLVHPNYANADGTINNFNVTVALTNVTSIEIDGTEYTNGEIASLAQGSTHTITANYDDTNYTFSSWSVSPAASGTIADSTSDETTYTVVADGATLTATASANCMSAISGTMQDFNPCSTIANGATGTLTDTRDSKTYSVAKLADGKFWMTSNLNLAGGTVLSSDKSDVPSASYYTLPASTAITSGTSVASGQFSSDSGEYVFNTGNNTTTCDSSTPCNSYYSWLTATAGGKDTSGTAVTGDGYNAAYSICPKGWRLPTATTEGVSRDSGGYTGGDFYQMILAVTGQSSLANGYYESTSNFYNNAGPGTTPGFLLAGNYYNSTFSDGGSYGYYWSSTSISGTTAYSLNFGSSRVSSASNDSRRRGFSVRCVFGE